MRRMLTDNNVVNMVNEAIEDGSIEIPSGLPEIQEGDADKVLAVNAGEDGVEWKTVSGGSSKHLYKVLLAEQGYVYTCQYILPSNTQLTTTTEVTNALKTYVDDSVNSFNKLFSFYTTASGSSTTFNMYYSIAVASGSIKVYWAEINISAGTITYKNTTMTVKGFEELI